MIKAWVRRWLQLDGPGGLADVLSVKDAEARRLSERLDSAEKLLRQAVPVLNDHTTSLQRFAVYEQQVPSIRRVYTAMREKAIREKRKQDAAAALAAPPTEPPQSEPPQDAVLDEVSAEVGGG